MLLRVAQKEWAEGEDQLQGRPKDGLGCGHYAFLRQPHQRVSLCVLLTV